MAAERRARAMGSDAHVVVVGPHAERLAHRALERVAQLEARWSRFRPDSEVSRCNRAAGEPVEVSADTVHLVAMAQEAWRRSGGAVDCTLLDQLEAAGYDRPRAELLWQRPADAAPDLLRPSLLGPLDIELTTTTVRLPRGVRFDPGGIGKGLAADVVAGELLAQGADGACVALGGDVRVRGEAPRGGGWTVAIDAPWQSEPLAMIGLFDGGVATSTTLLRRWRVGADDRHHLLDPGTGAPSASDVVFASAVAASAWEAEVLAKAVLLRGSEHPFDLVEGTGAHALIVTDTGRCALSRGFDHHLAGAVLPAHIDLTPPLEVAS